MGALIGKLVIFLRTRHHGAIGLDEFLSLGVIAISFGLALSCLTSGFLSVFFAGLALRRVRDHPIAGTISLAGGPAAADGGDVPATHSHHASGAMTHAVQGFNDQLLALHHGVSGSLAREMVSFVFVTVTTSILAHGMSMRPSMKTYARRIADRC